METSIRDFISGRLFSNGLRVSPHQISSSQDSLGVDLGSLRGRNASLLKTFSRSASVLHIGCADHAPLIESKMKSGTYLHSLIQSRLTSGLLWGLDSSELALKEMRRLGFENVTSSWDKLSSINFDVALLPDTIEHLQDPGGFLLDFRNKLSFHHLVVSVPNAYSLSNRFFMRSELINSDHRTLHSPFSLSKLLFESGFEVSALAFADHGGISKPLRTILKWRFPLLREHLIVLASRTS